MGVERKEAGAGVGEGREQAGRGACWLIGI
jgi:hypothetical protein